ncbi:MAG: PfkB family carbohydrate kinase [Brevinemataceae bacterium]
MLTDKEILILKEIEKNPLIKQEELAEILSISRTAIAAHISNLQKKGFILGRGYFLKYPSQVSIIGGICLAFEGKSNNNFSEKENNLGSVSISIKGTCYNIYKSLSQWNDNINYISFIGNDQYGESLNSLLKMDNISNLELKKIDNAHTAMYTSLYDNNSRFLGAVLSMDIFNQITLWEIKNILPKIQNSSILYIDSNYTVSILNEIANTNPTSYVIYNTITNNKAYPIDSINFRFDVLCSSIYEINTMYSTSFQTNKEVFNFLQKQGIQTGIIYSKTEVMIFQNQQSFVLKTKFSREHYISKIINILMDEKNFHQENFEE